MCLHTAVLGLTGKKYYIADALSQTLQQLVRSVARRDGDDRTVSELVRFQDALERLGLLWTPLDSLDKHQAHELVRNLHVSRITEYAESKENTMG